MARYGLEVSDITGKSMKTIETERLILRLMQREDAEVMYEMAKDQQVRKYLDLLPESFEQFDKNMKYYLRNNGKDQFNVIIEEKDTHKCVGVIWGKVDMFYPPLVIEISYMIEASSRKKGYMIEALSAFVEFFPKETHFRFFICPTNEASIRTVSKLQDLGLVMDINDRELTLDIYTLRWT